jgi:hypothetical protein
MADRILNRARRRRGLVLIALTLLAACDQRPPPAEAPSETNRPVSEKLTGTAANCPPPRGWVTDPERQPRMIEGPENRLALTRDDELLWNGTPIDLARLGQYLEVTNQMEPTPILVFQPDPGASCEAISRVVAATVTSGLDCAELCRFEPASAE